MTSSLLAPIEGNYGRPQALKLVFISTVRSTVHTNPSQKRTFRKRSSNKRDLKTLALRFSVDGKKIENEAFRERQRHDDHAINSKTLSTHSSFSVVVYCCVFKFLRQSVDGKYLMCFSK